jgi:deazaflavin-dependent oxidoreductase (nitroreductase family)
VVTCVAELGASNADIIAEFRANRGRVGGFFEDDSLLLLTTIGRKSGKEHTTPLSYIQDDGQLVVIGANLESSRTSDWFHNVTANPHVTVEVGPERYSATASIVEGERRAQMQDRMRAAWEASRLNNPNLPEMPVREDGMIPVVALSRPSDETSR